MPIKLVLADDHPIVLDGLENFLRQARDMRVLARCQNGEETLRAVLKHRPDVLVLDIRMPGKDGLAVLRQLKEEGTSTRVVLLTAGLDDNEAIEAVRLGVRGVVLKEMAPQLLMQCIRKVHAGEQWLEKRSFQSALETMLRREATARSVGVLTRREIEVVRLVIDCLRNREIAEKLSISEGTVKIHLHSIYEKLGVGGRMELSLYARDKGLV